MSMIARFPNAWRLTWITLLAVALFTVGRLSLSLDVVTAAPGGSKAEPHAESHNDAQFEAALRKAMDGPVDVFLDVVEIQDQKPMLSGVRFDGLVDVTGKHLLGFNDAKNQRWLIDPDAVLAFRVTRAKK